MVISDNEIAQVRAATDIVALISEQVALKKSGRRWTGLCPFHGEKTPSFSVNAEEGRYYCFGCRASGDQITFVREMSHLDFIDAVRLLADRAGIELHEDSSAGSARKERQELLGVMAKAVDWYHDRLLNSPDARPARDYLRSRGITGEIARQFKIGWAPDEWDGLSSALKLNEKLLTGTGLGFVNKRDRRQDALRARIIFPIFDPSGKAIAVGGRTLPAPFGIEAGNDSRVEAKYKNSPETPIYSKRRTLYGLNWAKDDIIRSGEIIVCEGYTDVIAFFGAGMPRAVATCGTALGEEHFRTMRNFARRIVLAYDADQAGQSAAASVYQWERQHEVDVVVARLPKGADPAALAQNDPRALRSAIEQSVPFLQFRLERVLEGADVSTVEGRARAAERAIVVLAEHPSELVRDQYLMQVADQLHLEPSSLRPRVNEQVHNPKKAGDAGAASTNVVRPRRSSGAMPRPGLEALRLLIHEPALVKERLVAPYFINEDQRDIYEGLSSGRTISEVVDAFNLRGDEEVAGVLGQLAVDELDREYSETDVIAVVSQLIRSAAGVELKQLERELRAGTMAPDVVIGTIRDVKDRLSQLDSAHGEVAEQDLRAWLVERASKAP
ncbi:MAG: DNA primase [Acidimicrobiaceae bacterium]|nr:DNA primase [Acidimicrobiaceae bacterium]